MARPFNKYGVAVVSNTGEKYHLIDQTGKEIPGTRFEYISHYYDYDERFLEFGYDYYRRLIGLYDTKERKILFEPEFAKISIEDDDHILVCKRDGEYGKSDFRQYYINMNGDILYPWLSKQRFAIVNKPDKNNVTAVAVSEYTELTGKPSCFYAYKGKKYEKRLIYGLYSSKERFVMPLEYDKIRRLSDTIWACYKGEEITIVETEPED